MAGIARRCRRSGRPWTIGGQTQARSITRLVRSVVTVEGTLHSAQLRGHCTVQHGATIGRLVNYEGSVGHSVTTPHRVESAKHVHTVLLTYFGKKGAVGNSSFSKT